MSRGRGFSPVVVVFCWVILRAAAGFAGEMSFQGEIRSWAAAEAEPAEKRELGLRYLPRIAFSSKLGGEWRADGELTGNLYGHMVAEGDEAAATDQTAKTYRAWARLYTDRSGIRLGLQEISFGPGKILRSLRWFDQKDSRDPTEFSDGVNALLFRHYFRNNASIWVWEMAGNENPMGISLLRTADGTLESGGRLQLPLGSGEIGLSAHTRQADAGVISGYSGTRNDRLSENRIGMDLSWDLGVGVYLETTRLQLAENGLIPERQWFLTLGADYTFAVGDGLGTVVEVMGVDLQYEDSHRDGGTVWLASASGQLPLNLMDSLQLMLFHNFESEGTMLQGSWQRTTDNWILSLIAYSSRMNSGGTASEPYGVTGSAGQEGIRVMFQYNH